MEERTILIISNYSAQTVTTMFIARIVLMTTSGVDIQIENGNFTRVHNDIWNALARAPLTSTEFRCLMFLFRETYGWQRKETTVSMSIWAKAIELDRRAVIRAVQHMLNCNVIRRTDNGSHRPATWGFNKYFEQWDFAQTSDNSVTSSSDNSVTSSAPTSDNSVTKTSDNSVTHIKKRKKDIKNTSPAPLTPQQELFGAICAAVSWNVATLTKEDKGQVAQVAGILNRAGYGAEDVQRFMQEVWAFDWRFEKKGQAPTLRQLRQEIGKLKRETPTAGNVIVEIDLAPSQHYPDGHKVRQSMPRAEAVAQGYRILEEAK